MALSAKSKQKKLAKKASKRKAKKQSNSASQLSKKEKMENKLNLALQAPIHECWIPEELFEDGIGNLVFSRQLSPTRIGLSVFLVDVWAKGVVDCYYDEMSKVTYDQQMQEVARRISPMKAIDPASFKKLLEGAVSFAASHQFAAHPDYQVVKQVFQDVDASASHDEFEFGKEGMPFVVKRGCHDPGCGHDHG